MFTDSLSRLQYTRISALLDVNFRRREKLEEGMYYAHENKRASENESHFHPQRPYATWSQLNLYERKLMSTRAFTARPDDTCCFTKGELTIHHRGKCNIKDSYARICSR